MKKTARKVASAVLLLVLLAVMFVPRPAVTIDAADSKTDSASQATVDAKPLGDIFGEIKTKYEVADMMDFSKADDLNRFYGIEVDQVKDFAGGINKSGVDQEEIVIVLAADSKAAESIKASLENRLESKLSQTKNYNAEQYAIVEKCSVDVNDNYVSLFVSKNADAMKEDFKKAISGS